MGFRHDEWAARVPVRTGPQRLVLLLLNIRADDDTGICWPGVAELVRRSCMNRKTVLSALAGLVELGVIVRTKRPHSNANQYRLRYEMAVPDEHVEGSTGLGTSQIRDIPNQGQPKSQIRDDGSTGLGTTVVPNQGHESTKNLPRNNQGPTTSMSSSASEGALAPAVPHAEPPDFDFEEIPFPDEEPPPPSLPPAGREKVERPARAYPQVDCKAVVELYHEICTALPQVQVLNDARRRTIGARWRELCKEDGFTTREAALGGFRWYFEQVAASRFLCGFTQPGPGRDRVFRADFDWLMGPKNFLKVCEGKYRNGVH